MLNFSNPRLVAEFDDWPLGLRQRGYCKFHLEYNPKKGWRFVRQTTGKPKTATFGGKGAIVDGDDGRTYLIQFAGAFDFINVWRSDFKCVHPDLIGNNGGVFPKDALYPVLRELIEQANA